MEDAKTTTKNRHGVVLAGGASLGAVQVGMMKALTQAHTPVDFLVGTSVGAINAAWMAGHHDATGVDGLVEIWRNLRRRDVFTTKPTHTFVHHACGAFLTSHHEPAFKSGHNRSK